MPAMQKSKIAAQKRLLFFHLYLNMSMLCIRNHVFSYVKK